MKNTLEGINSRLDDTRKQINDLEDRVVEITQAEQKKEERIIKNKDNIKHSNIHIIGFQKEEREEAEKLFEKDDT